ncbi:type II secretion system protein [Geminisphaera colitermitum]|uniref:type II secretion system protein n=1 Tax=Geminisphaera colitermitum TaxID=1148786 RepID=UPI0005BC21C6|nr:prepilin-type N-terminal cleavage/methylation domain-containing protein [Geminisphaera colitermitum]
MSQRPHRRPDAFTLIELLTVIAIIGILAAIIIPTLGKVRESAFRAQTISKLRQIIIATMSYGNENKGRPPYPLGDSNNPTFGNTPHAYSVTAYNGTLKPYLGDRYTALYSSKALAQIPNYNPDEERQKEANSQTPSLTTHFTYFQREGGTSRNGRPKDAYVDLFKNLNNPSMDYAIWGTLAFTSAAKTLAYAEADNNRQIPLSGMFAGYADCSVKWFKRKQLSTYDTSAEGMGYLWPKPKNE